MDSMNVTVSELVSTLPSEIRNPRLFSLPTEEFRSYFNGFNRNSSLRTILRLSVLSNNTSLFRAIAKAFPEINFRIYMYSCSNLSHYAAYHGNLEILNHLIRAGASITEDGMVNDTVYGTPAEIALQMNHEQCYSLLQTQAAMYEEYTKELFDEIYNDMEATQNMNKLLNIHVTNSLTEDHQILDDAMKLLDRLKLKQVQLFKTESLRLEDLPRLKLTIQSYKTFTSMIEFGKRKKLQDISKLNRIRRDIITMFDSENEEDPYIF